MNLSVNPAAAWARYALTRRVLASVAGPLSQEGVDVLAVKGVVTSAWLYRDVDERPMTDLDVRVRPEDLSRVLAIAAASGWRLVRHLHSYGSVVLRVDGVDVDIEARIGPPGVCALPIARVFDRAVRQESGFWIPDPHDHAVLLVVNVFKDKLTGTMPWALEDVVRVVDAPGFTTNTFLARVRDARVAGPTWVVADWMAREKHHAGWLAIRELLGGETPTRRRYATWMRDLIARGRPDAIALRVLARMASDEMWRWPVAVTRSAAAELELAWYRRRARRPR